MSLNLIDKYYNKLQMIKQFGGSPNELSIREAFKELLGHYANKNNLMLISELRVKGTKGEMVQPDGTLKNALRLDYGYWESKDSKDDIDTEINNKIRKGYPLTNILFEDTKEAVLIQHGEPTHRIKITDREKLNEILNAFVFYEHPEITEFHKALEQFKTDLPHITEALRQLLEKEGKENSNYIKAKEEFLENCKIEINPNFTGDDVREMVIQHILTEEIFNAVFDESQFHMENNIARKLDGLIKTFFVGDKKRNTLDSIKHYYNVISSTAKNIVDHHEKQKFLKVIYENFYKSYNPKAADRLGVIYTPNEIVNFMIESTNFLLDKHFNKTLADKNVEILDPATGTGTFICDLIEHISPDKLVYKYKNEIHANEVAILPYYVANLNIEYTFKQKMDYYSEFPNLCFVDTLDNTGALTYAGKQEILFGLSSENAERIRKQNEKKISVIIGNPPYNTNQLNENENNKNREYPEIDKRIKHTYIEESTAQKTKLYDMYTRFLRWATDRIDRNGIIAFVSNNSFINTKTYDGFRKLIAKDFNEIWIIDLKGNARTSGERRKKEAGNIFNDQIRVGVAVYFLVKNSNQESCKIYYNTIEDFVKSEEKREYLRTNTLSTLNFQEIKPDKKNNWINLTDTDFNTLIPIGNKETKYAKKREEESALFNLYTLGTVSNRDDWVYDFSQFKLKDKINFFIETYNNDVKKYSSKVKKENVSELIKDSPIKYTRDLKKLLIAGQKLEEDNKEYRKCLYRIYCKKNLYFESHLNEMRYQIPIVFPKSSSENILIAVNVSSKQFNVLASKYIVDLHFNGDSQCFPLFKYHNDEKLDNITDWGWKEFKTYYHDAKITKGDLFHYIYGVLHNPIYRTKYEVNLEREFPRIPFYKDFKKWSNWGKELMDLHINFENVDPYDLLCKDDSPKVKKDAPKLFLPKVKEPETMFGIKPKLKVKLKADKENGKILIDEITTLSRVPKLAWEYKLGNRSAIEWILEYYKEKKPKDKTIAEKFNTYNFADYKEEVIELIKKVCTVSVKTMEIVNKMEKEKQ